MADLDALEALFVRWHTLRTNEKANPSLLLKRHAIPYDYRDPNAFQNWLVKLPAHVREKAEVMLKTLRELDAAGPETLIVSEITENIPQLTYFLLMRSIELEVLASVQRSAGEAGSHLLQKGIDPGDLALFAKQVAGIAIYEFVNLLDGVSTPDLPDNAPGWILMETDADQHLTGRNLAGLDEYLGSYVHGGESMLSEHHDEAG